jgi:hypothetical protein
MVPMKLSPRLRLEPRPSRLGCAAVVTGCALAAILVIVLPLDAWAVAVAWLAIVLVIVRGLHRCGERGAPALLHVGLDRRITVSARDGRSRDGAILDDSYVGAWLTTIVWRPDGAAWYAPTRSILILPDTLPADEFRRLRVVLRYGRSAVEARTSGVDAA